MQIHRTKTLIVSAQLLLLLFSVPELLAQGGDVRWLRVGSLRSYYNEQGAEFESSRAGAPVICDGMAWPAAYGFGQSTIAARALWIGCKNFYDPVMRKTFPAKVVGRGPRDNLEWNIQIFPAELKMVGRFDHPLVTVDGTIATENQTWDEVDEFDEQMLPDRMIVTKFHTSMGVTVTRKIMAFSQQNHDNYFVVDYVFKNTGIIDGKGTKYEQKLEDCYFWFDYRYALSGEAVTGYNVGYGLWNMTWGRNTVNDVVGTNPAAPGFEFRAHYAWYGPHSERTVSDDWGLPNERANLDDNIWDEALAAAKYVGCITLHADQSPHNPADNPYQPVTTNWLGSDAPMLAAGVSQYDEVMMLQRYAFMSSGHPELTHAQAVGDGYADKYGDDAGGYSQTQGFGPYSLEVGDSVHIVLAEAVAGLSREKNREVAKNWLTYATGVGTPTLIMPDGKVGTNHDEYKRAWVQTGRDSLTQTFRTILRAYKSGFNIPQPPPPPTFFTVTSGGDRIRLSWDSNAQSHPHFNGYEIWRAQGIVDEPTAVYQKIFACDRANVVHVYDDTTARRGLDYYYYVVSKDDGSQNDLRPGVPLKSSMFYTLTNTPAYLRREAGKALEEIRVVPNPYVISKRALQFGVASAYDRIAFYNIPPFCEIRIYTEKGDLIWKKIHDDGSGDELWESVTSSGQIIVSGLYIAYFEVTQDYSDPKTGALLFRTGENTYRKIIVIR